MGFDASIQLPRWISLIVPRQSTIPSIPPWARTQGWGGALLPAMIVVPASEPAADFTAAARIYVR